MDTRDNQRKNELLEMKDDYLWDRSGTPDPEIQRLEAALATFRHERPAPVFPALVADRRWKFLPLRLFPAVAAASALIVIVAGIVLLYGRRPALVNSAGWDISSVSGTPRIGTKIITQHETRQFGVGQILETDHQSRLSLEAEGVGQIQVEPGTRLRLLSMGTGLNRLALDLGTIQAFIWAPPGQFVVDTPSALTVDLGCAYTLHVDDSGAGLVRTSRGWVGFKLNGHESFIPAGAACATRPKVGPGTPYFENASPELRAALARFDFEDTTAQERAADLAIVLRASRKGDALTLWHLLTRADESQRDQVYDRLRALAPPPAGVTREGVLRLDQAMLDQWWNELGFDDISVWRHWERSWPATTSPSREK
jgi:hypothetical protein